LRNRVDSAETPILVQPRWYWMALGLLYLPLGVWHLIDGTWWFGIVWIVTAAGWFLHWYRRPGVYQHGESIVLRGGFRARWISIDTIGDVGESLPTGPVVPADPEWSRGPFVLFLHDGSEVRIEEYLPGGGRRRDRAIEEIREWSRRAQHPA